VKRAALGLLALAACASWAFAGPLVDPAADRVRIVNRITDIKKQVKRIDAELSTGKLPSDKYAPLQDYRTTLEQERQSLDHELQLMDNRSPLIAYFGGGSPAAVERSTAPAKTLWETGGWARYDGVLPCIGCDGVKTEITFYSDGFKYTMTERYLGASAPDREFASDGVWTPRKGNGNDPDATVFVLDYDRPGHERHFLKIGDDQLKLLDLDESKLRRTPNLILKRVAP
jgi:hypothetical protein